MNKITLGIGLCQTCQEIKDIMRLDISGNMAVVITLECGHRMIIGNAKMISHDFSYW